MPDDSTATKDGMDTDTIAKQLISLPSTGFLEVARATEFRCYRTRKDGVGQKVTVTLLDRGSERPGIRYACEAVADDGATASGNGASSPEVAIALVHWNELDS